MAATHLPERCDVPLCWDGVWTLLHIVSVWVVHANAWLRWTLSSSLEDVAVAGVSPLTASYPGGCHAQAGLSALKTPQSYRHNASKEDPLHQGVLACPHCCLFILAKICGPG